MNFLQSRSPPLSSFGDNWYPSILSCDFLLPSAHRHTPPPFCFSDDEQWQAPNSLENLAYFIEKAYNRAHIDI